MEKEEFCILGNGDFEEVQRHSGRSVHELGKPLGRLTLDNKSLVIQNGKAHFSHLSIEHHDVLVLDDITLLRHSVLWV